MVFSITFNQVNSVWRALFDFFPMVPFSIEHFHRRWILREGTRTGGSAQEAQPPLSVAESNSCRRGTPLFSPLLLGASLLRFLTLRHLFISFFSGMSLKSSEILRYQELGRWSGSDPDRTWNRRVLLSGWDACRRLSIRGSGHAQMDKYR